MNLDWFLSSHKRRLIMKEEAIIRKLYPRGLEEVDDCFYDGERLYSTDSLVEGTHFLHEWSSPKDIAIKLIETNISDIISSGGYPDFCFLNLGLSNLSKKKTGYKHL